MDLLLTRSCAMYSALDLRMFPKYELMKQEKPGGRVGFVAPTDVHGNDNQFQRNLLASKMCQTWSSPEMYFKHDLPQSGEFMARYKTQGLESGHMMTETQGHRDAIQYVKDHITKELFEERMAFGKNKGEDGNPKLTMEMWHKIQKDPDNNDTVWMYFNDQAKNNQTTLDFYKSKREGDVPYPDIYNTAWGELSKTYAKNCGEAGIPLDTNGLAAHAKPLDSIQIKDEIPQYKESLREFLKDVKKAADVVEENKADLSENADVSALIDKVVEELMEGATKMEEGMKKIYPDSYIQEWKENEAKTPKKKDGKPVWDQRTDEQKEIGKRYAETSDEGTDLLKQGRNHILDGIMSMKKTKLCGELLPLSHDPEIKELAGESPGAAAAIEALFPVHHEPIDQDDMESYLRENSELNKHKKKKLTPQGFIGLDQKRTTV